MINKIKIISFLVITYGLMIILIIQPKLENSELENRQLSKLPVMSLENIYSGAFMTDFDDYIDDHFAFRNRFVKLSKKLRSYHGFFPESEPKIIKPKKSAEISDSTLSLDSINIDALEEEKSHGLLILNGAAYQIFGGNNFSGSGYAALINEYRKIIPKQVRVIDIVIPTSSSFVKDSSYSYLRSREYGSINFIGSNLLPSIKYISAAEKMLENQNEYLFFRTDHHWNGLGVYCAYKAFSDDLGFASFSLEQLQSHKIPNFIGSLYSKTMDETLAENKDTLEYFKTPVGYECFMGVNGSSKDWKKSRLLYTNARGGNAYGVFLGGDRPILKVVSENKNGRRAVLVKNSYGNPFATMVYHHYEELYIVDLRYYKEGLLNLVKDKIIHDVIILNGVFSANSNGTRSLMRGLIKGEVDFSDFELNNCDSLNRTDTLLQNIFSDSLEMEQKLDTLK